MGNGYAPTITIRNADGDVVFDESVPFLPQDTNMTSLGVVKVTDGLPEQLGLVGFFYPTQAPLDTRRLHLGLPRAHQSRAHAQRLRGRPRDRRRHAALGLHARPDRHDAAHRRQDRRRLDRARARRDGRPAERPRHHHVRGRVARRRGGLRRSRSSGSSRSRSTATSRRPWVLVFAVLALAGLLAALFVPRRRMWVKVTPDGPHPAARVRGPRARRGPDARMPRSSRSRSATASRSTAPVA